MASQEILESVKTVGPIIWSVFSAIVTVASVIVGFFLKRIIKQFDAFTEAVSGLKEFMAVQKEKNQEVDEIKGDLKDHQQQLNDHEKRLIVVEEHNKNLKLNGAN